jgi:uncharacterized integral membrane protein (TIGR00697 family)
VQAATIYIAAVLLANLTATAFIPFPVFGQVSIGTLIFGLTFTQRDRMHRMGRPFVYKIIALSGVLTLLLLLSIKYLWGPPVVMFLQDRQFLWTSESLMMLTEGGPRVFIASFLAIIFAETADTEVYHKFRDRSWIGRVLRSNAVSVPLDSITFNLIAFLGLFQPIMLLSVIFGEIVVKFAVSAIYALVHPNKR